MTDYLAQRRRAYAASRRMTPLSPCGCIRYPGPDRHRCKQEMTEVQAIAAIAAAQHLQMLGTPGLFDRTACRAMHQLGYQDLAYRSFEYSHGEAA